MKAIITAYNLRPIYEIDDVGNIYNIKYNRFLHPTKDHNGYLQVKVGTNDGKYKSLLVHRLVALTFIPNPQNLETVNHIDGNKLNNSVSNLEWMSLLDNTNDAKRLGYNGNYADITEELVDLVINDLENGKTIKQIMRDRNVSKGFVSRIRQRKRHKHKSVTVLGLSRKYSLETKKAICYLVKEGVKDSDITEYFHLSRGYTYNVKAGKSLKAVMRFVIDTNYKPSETIERHFFKKIAE